MNAPEAIFESRLHSDDLEQSVLGVLLVQSDRLESAPTLRPEHFYRADHRVIFSCISAMFAKGISADVIGVSDALGASGELEKCGGLAYLADMANNCGWSAETLPYNASRLRDYALERALLGAAEGIIETIHGVAPVAEKLEAAQSRLMALSESSMPKQPRMIREGLKTHIDTMMARCDGKLSGLMTGFDQLDMAMKGMKPGNLIYVAGRPGMGKTTLAMNIAEHAALEGQPVLVLSLEMGEAELIDRAVASIGRIPLEKVLIGCPDDDDAERHAYAIGRLADCPLILDEQGGLTVSQVRTKARSVKRTHGLSLLVVDYLQLMTSGQESENARLTEISTGLKALAKELQIPVICLSQLNRNCEGRPNKRPMMSDLRGSGSIEQDADLILFVYRDEVYDEQSPDKGTAEIIIGKSRQGQTGMVRLAWNGRCTRFDNLAHGWAPEEKYQPMRKKSGAFRGE